MIPGHESFDSATYHPDPDERRRDALMDAGGFPAHAADVAATGYDPDRNPPPSNSHFATRRPAKGRPGEGRQAHDWDEAVHEHEPLSDEQVALNANKAAELRDKLLASQLARAESPEAQTVLRALAMARSKARGKRW